MERRKDSKGKVLNTGESQRKDGSYMYRYTNYFGDRCCVYGKTLQELREKERKIQDDIEDGIITTDITLNELFDKWIVTKVKIKPRTQSRYAYHYKLWVRNSMLGDMPVNRIKMQNIKLFYSQKSKTLSSGSLKVINRILMPLFDYACDNDIIRKNPAKHCIGEFTSASEKRPSLSKEDTKKFLAFAEEYNSKYYCGKENLLFIKFLLNTGLRYGEGAGLTWKDIDFEKGLIDVNHQFILGGEDGYNKYHIGTLKNRNAKRKVPISNETREILKEVKNVTSKYTNVSLDGHKNFVFKTLHGYPVLNSTCNEYCSKVVKKYNMTHDDKLPTISCHILRHTFCTRLAENNINQEAFLKIVGHATYNFSQQVYIDVEEKFVIDEFNKAVNE